MTSPLALGIFGGTFDPIHHGHLRVALDVLETLPIESIRFVPSARPPHRTEPGASAAERLALLEAAVAEQSGFFTDSRELDRQGLSYTVDTLTEIRAEHPNRSLCLLLGMDAFHGLPTWHRWREILSLAHIVVMSRAGIDAVMPEALRALIDDARADRIDSLGTQRCGTIWLQTVTPLAISATEIRQRLYEGRSAQFFVPRVVSTLIDRHGLYRPSAIPTERKDDAIE